MQCGAYNTIPSLRPGAKDDAERRREMDFNNSGTVAPLNEYKPMSDPHLKHHWKNPRHQTFLKASGFLDEKGAALDVDQHRRKLYVIETDLVQADKMERARAVIKDQRMRDREILAKREEVNQRRLRQIHAIRDERRRKRAAAQAVIMSGSPLASGGSCPQRSSSLPTLST